MEVRRRSPETHPTRGMLETRAPPRPAVAAPTIGSTRPSRRSPAHDPRRRRGRLRDQPPGGRDRRARRRRRRHPRRAGPHDPVRHRHPPRHRREHRQRHRHQLRRGRRLRAGPHDRPARSACSSSSPPPPGPCWAPCSRPSSRRPSCTSCWGSCSCSRRRSRSCAWARTSRPITTATPLAARLRLAGSYPDPALGREVAYAAQRIPLGFALMLGAGSCPGCWGSGQGRSRCSRWTVRCASR